MPVQPLLAQQLAGVRVDPRFVASLRDLVRIAERTFGPGKGASKKAYVREAAHRLMEQTPDIRWLPDAIEDAIKAALVDLLIEVVWALLFGKADAAAA